MANKDTVRTVQQKILETAKYIDALCKKAKIEYFIMGGTALGAVRHGGFIPWDDDLDIFMTPKNYRKFKSAFNKEKSEKFVLQEWETVPGYLEYAKVRMNGTTFIEHNFLRRRDIHQGIYVDIMILHKVKNNALIKKLTYLDSKFVTLVGLSERNWKPKSKAQSLILALLKILPKKFIAKRCYKRIYKYDDLKSNYSYCYWITPAKYKSGLFSADFFEKSIRIPFEDTTLSAPEKIKEYLTYRYGDYMKMPSAEQQKAAVHAEIFDTKKDYTFYLK